MNLGAREWEEFILNLTPSQRVSTCRNDPKHVIPEEIRVNNGSLPSAFSNSVSTRTIGLSSMNMRQWISLNSCKVTLSESHRIGKAVDSFSMRSIQCPKPICFHLTLACQGSKSKCWKPRVSTITFKPGGVLKALIIPVKPFMKRMAITDLAGMHSQLHETRNKKKHTIAEGRSDLNVFHHLSSYYLQLSHSETI